MQYKFTIVIPTKNRLEDLKITLEKLKFLFERGDVHFLICDDGSTDGTFEYISTHFPKIEIFSNKISRGIHHTRNRLMERVKSPYAINIDDDIHFITQDPIEIIEEYFNLNPNCAILGFRIFWSKSLPDSIETNDIPHRVKSFGAGASVWRMSAWNEIPNYPEWFVFYGEEDFASYHLFKKDWEIHYLPEVLVNHRVNIKERKKGQDYSLRLQRSLRSGWYLYFLFYPIRVIPKKLAYSVWSQFKSKVFKGDFKALKAILLALFDLIFSIPKIIKNSNRLSIKEYNVYQKLEETKLYWHPEDK
ncbi:glycosyltransferase family 2 protein [Flavobacterium sp. Root420]|uniref:glycosyltransferase family 2 protein n=1 Tax=Flavobacterium sp. Root420 TaxID=1736533 RepID=UPI0006F3C604|nr:glycosyltransferase [Flavobacterium sp. Root420]KQW97708.1 glycosyl transferase [Flavobacterium sp. Root420]